MFTDEKLSRLRRVGSYALLLLQGLALALWLERLVTLKWQYHGCFVPVYGWPLPNRRYSEVSSLEYAVDWQAYAIDLSVYATIILVALFALRLLLQGHWKPVNLVLTVMLISAPLKLFTMSLWFEPLGIAEPMRQAGVSVAASGAEPCSDNSK